MLSRCRTASGNSVLVGSGQPRPREHLARRGAATGVAAIGTHYCNRGQGQQELYC
jgi:hypothetical protein